MAVSLGEQLRSLRLVKAIRRFLQARKNAILIDVEPDDPAMEVYRRFTDAEIDELFLATEMLCRTSKYLSGSRVAAMAREIILLRAEIEELKRDL